MKRKPDQYKAGIHYILIAAISALFFIPFLGHIHLFDWDEINFAESAREMLASGDYLNVRINFVPFWEKPPLFIWMQVVSMKIFGINEFAARFPNAVCGIVTLPVLFYCGKKFRDTDFGLTWIILYAGSVLPFLYFKSGIIDPWFNLFIFLGIYNFHFYFEPLENRIKRTISSAFFIGLAILTKGPVAFLIFILVFIVFLLIKKFRVKVRVTDVLLFSAVLLVTGGLWFIMQIMQGNFSVIADFIEYQIRLFKTQDAGHGGFLLYHFVVLFVGVFPASIIALPAFFRSRNALLKDNALYIWMLILFWVVLLLFTIVKTKIVHYSSLCYFPLTFLATWAVIYYRESFGGWWKRIIIWTIAATGIIIAIATCMLTFTDEFKHFIIEKGWIRDSFAIANLSAEGEWKGMEFLAGVLLIAGITGFLISVNSNFIRAIRLLCFSTAIFMFISLLIIAPGVERYSQRAAIEFFESVSDENAYMITVGYKSYAHLFYGKIHDHSRKQESYDKHWLLSGNIDKTVYISTKITKKDKLINEYPHLVLLYEKNGFVFFKRDPLRSVQMNNANPLSTGMTN